MSKKNRLINLFKNIKDKHLKEVIANVVVIEQQNRTSSNQNFPKQKLRDVIDAVARIQELEKS